MLPGLRPPETPPRLSRELPGIQDGTGRTGQEERRGKPEKASKAEPICTTGSRSKKGHPEPEKGKRMIVKKQKHFHYYKNWFVFPLAVAWESDLPEYIHKTSRLTIHFLWYHWRFTLLHKTPKAYFMWYNTMEKEGVYQCSVCGYDFGTKSFIRHGRKCPGCNNRLDGVE